VHILVAQKGSPCLRQLTLQLLVASLDLLGVGLPDRLSDGLLLLLKVLLELEVLISCGVKLLSQIVMVLLEQLQRFIIQVSKGALILELEVGLLDFVFERGNFSLVL